MKLTTFIILTACLTASAGGYTQTVTLSLKSSSLVKAFAEIEKQTGYSFVYGKEQLANTRAVDINVKDEKLETVLAILFKDQPLTYTITAKYISIKLKSLNENPGDISPDHQITQSPIDITGKVTDADGNPLSGATVKVKGTNKATTTNNDGVFVLKGVDDNATLEISFVGYETLNMPVNGRATIVTSLKMEVKNMNEVVINKGYYAEKQKYSVGNVSKVTGAEIEKQPVNNPLMALEGRVPGLFITQSTGLPGSGIRVQIQGQNSINSGNDPLYVIDGVPYTSQLLPNLGGVLGRSGSGDGNPLSFINPADIESVEILKDADATSIYGSRAANGAILISTKKGKIGQTKVDINFQQGWGEMTRKMDLLNLEQYLQMRHEGKNNSNSPVLPTDVDINGVWDTTRYTDWQEKLIGNNAHYTLAQANFSGGNFNTQFVVGAGYRRETTVFPGDFADQKGSLHFNINNTSLNQRFRFQFSGNYLVDNNELPNQDLTLAAVTLAPDAPPLYNPDASLNWAPNSTGSSTWANPLSQQFNTYQNQTSNLTANAILDYEIIQRLHVKSSFGYTRLQSKETQVYPLTYYAPENRAFYQRSGMFGNNEINSWIIEPQLNYKISVAKASFEVLAGMTIQQNKNDGQQLLGMGYNSDDVITDIKSASSVTAVSTISSMYKYNAAFSRINFSWQEKYLINLTARRDGSSRFGAQNQFRNFASAGVGWIFSKESFIQKAIPFLSFGKLRASYGTSGNDQIGDYQYLNLYYATSADVPYQGTTGLTTYSLPNPYLQWEETRKLQLAFEMGIIKERINLIANYYRNRSSNQLLGYSLPLITGVAAVSDNFPATVQNSGWELTLNSINVKTKTFSWTTNCNLTRPKNKLIEFPGLSTSSYANNLVIGKPITLQFVYHFAGVNSNTGLYEVQDKNGNLTSNPNWATDRVVGINTSPELFGGVENNFRYKAFELDLLFQFTKQKGQNYRFGTFPGFFVGNLGNQPVSVLNRWQKPGEVKFIQKYSSDFLPFQQMAANLSDAAWSNASYIRLKNLSLAWQLPDAWSGKAHLQSARLMVQAQNILTITNYIGLDPETKSSTTLPPLKVLTVGLNITL